ncbi:MAG: peptidyl-prolyl cis-trans isomerase [Undibacterium sp.]|nr:peptidyl-prolyl cis-trans isomerase [Undibacterium sp.]
MTFKPAHLLVALLVTALPAMAQNIATVNGKGIPASKQEPYLKQAKAQGQKDTPELRAMIKERLVGTEVLLQAAEKAGFSKNEDVKLQIEMARQQILVQSLMKAHIEKNPISDADIKAAYETAKAQNGENEYHPYHILFDKEDDAKAAISKLKAGAKFEELAKASKDQGSAGKGGDLDWISQANVPPEFATALAALKKGQFTETPVKTNAGFHIIKLDDTRPLKFPALEEVKQQVGDGLVQEKIRAYQQTLIKQAVIK